MAGLRDEYAEVGDRRRTANATESEKNGKGEKKLKISAIKNFRNTDSPRVLVAGCSRLYIFFEDIDCICRTMNASREPENCTRVC